MATAMEEMGIAASLPHRLASKRMSFEKVLDLTDIKVLNQLKIRPGDLRKSSYEITQQIGDLAQKYNFDAIKAPSTANEAGTNLIMLGNNNGIK